MSKIVSKTRVGGPKGGYYQRVRHPSSSTSTDMIFGLYLPTSVSPSTPVLYWLSGLTCDDTNFANKAGSRAFDAAEKEGIAIVMPDTSPRNDDSVPNVDSYDLGIGAGFYVNATKAPYDKHYKMYQYVTEELPSLLKKEFGIGDLKSITGHSMGGHGALTIALKNPSEWVSVSAFSPICNPTKCPWGEKAFTAYLGGVEAGKAHDATCLMQERATPFEEFDDIMIEQGLNDEFLEGQLYPDALKEAATKCGQKVTFNMREGFDHSYHFIAAFIEDHVAFHGERLRRKQKQLRMAASTTPTPSRLPPAKRPRFTSWTYDEPCTTMEWNKLVPTTLSIADDAEAAMVIYGVFEPPSEKEHVDTEEGDDYKAPIVSLTGKAKEMDDATGGALTQDIQDNNFKYAVGSTLTFRLVTGGKVKRISILGLGKAPTQDDKKKTDHTKVFKIAKAIADRCKEEKKVTSCAVVLPHAFDADSKVLQDISSTFYSTLYSDNRYRTGSKVKKIAEDLVSIKLLLEGKAVENADAALMAGKYVAQGVFLAKDIVNAPHNVLNSLTLANVAQQIAAESNDRIKCTILGKDDCEQRGMGAYLGVARGSETEPQFIHLTYTPKQTSGNEKKIGIVGKGLLFDTGGYNIKTAMMGLMKFDCGGSAAVLGAARAIASLEPEGVEAHFIVAACENMINSKAYVPSDVLTASNGKTIEVLNTDAEGRLTLADALVFADKEVGCEKIIELSTLTGACMISLGLKIAGVWTDDDDLAAELDDVSKATGDKTWRMPLAKEYEGDLDSKIADTTNYGPKTGGAITAGLFLQKFVSKTKPFSHIDIAGPVWSDKDGATGFGARLVTEWVKRQGW